MTVEHWFLAGSHPHEYEHELVGDERHEGRRVVAVRFTGEKPSGFGTLMQQCAPDDLLGRRVRLSGSARSSEVGGWAGLWLRVDGRSGTSLAFDNMQDRSIKGTTAWARYDVVLDVSEEAIRLAYGVLLSGDGEVAVADFCLEEVGSDVPTTDRKHLDRPRNLDFSET